MQNSQLAINGGNPVRQSSWPTYDKGDVLVDENDEEIAIEAIRKHLYFRYDRRPFNETYTGKFESKLQEYFGVKHALAVSSGTAAITLGLLAAGLKKGDKVACPAFTFAATPSAILLAGCEPVIVEVDENLHIDIDDLKQKIQGGIKAIVPVHMRGLACNIKSVIEIANEANIPVIEDVVAAFGASFENKKLGTFGKAGAFSTQSDKSLNTGEGGFLLTDDTELFAKAICFSGAFENRFLKHFENSTPPQISDLEIPLYNFRMDEIRAAIGISQMDKLPNRLNILSENYKYVVSKLSDIVSVRQPITEDGILGESLLFRLKTDSKMDPEWFAKALTAEGISARAFSSKENPNVRCFWNWKFLFPDMQIDKIKDVLPNSANYLSAFIDVPLSPLLKKTDLDNLVEAVSKILNNT